MISIESANALRGNLIVDIGASNVEDLLTLMRKFKGSHENFDYSLVPAISDIKQ